MRDMIILAVAAIACFAVPLVMWGVVFYSP